MRLFLHAELICSMGRRERETGGDREKCAHSTIQPFPVPLKQGQWVVSGRLLGVVPVPVWPLRGAPAWAQLKACLKQREIWNSKDILLYFCLLNASSSEAMFLLKPLKELRAKRKGMDLFILCSSECACTSQQLWFKVCIFHGRDSHWQKMKRWDIYTFCGRQSCLLVFLQFVY